MGADTLHDLPNWRDPAAICRLATPLAVHRAGEPPLDFAVLAGVAPSAVRAEAELHVIDMPQLAISSSEIRARVARGEPIDDMVPAAVAGYIAERGLYGRR